MNVDKLIRVGNTWVWPDGMTIPVVSGGDGPIADPAAQQSFSEGVGESGLTGADNMVNVGANGVLTGVTPAMVPPPMHAPVAPTNPGGTSGTPARVFTEAEVEAIRREEKDKLYPSIEELKGQLKTLQDERQTRLTAEEQVQQQAEEQARLAAEEEMTFKDLLNQRNQEWESKFSELHNQLEQRDALLEQERRLHELTSYRAGRIEQERENIAPQLIDLVSGNNEEEIEQSIASLRERTEAILRDVQAAQASYRQQMPGSSVTAPPVGPLENQESNQTITADDIRQMDPSVYAQHRDRLLASMRQQVATTGIYGNNRR